MGECMSGVCKNVWEWVCVVVCMGGRVYVWVLKRVWVLYVDHGVVYCPIVLFVRVRVAFVKKVSGFGYGWDCVCWGGCMRGFCNVCGCCILIVVLLNVSLCCCNSLCLCTNNCKICSKIQAYSNVPFTLVPDCWLKVSQYLESPPTGHLGTGFAWFPCVCL